MRIISVRPQRTLCRPVEIRGVGYLTGANVTLRLLPAPAGAGITFVRTDLSPRFEITAKASNITATNRRTTLGMMPRCVTLVEHILATLAGFRIDNCTIELNAMEPPGLDGSSWAYSRAIESAGIQNQALDKTIWAVDSPIKILGQGASLCFFPPKNNELRISYLVDYGQQSPIIPQRHTETISPLTFARELAACRTYLLEEEALALQQQGIGKRTRVNDLVVFGKRGPINNRLRFANEPARHKILDILGDLSLTGSDVRGHIVAYRSGHPHNAELARAIVKQFADAVAADRSSTAA